MLLRSVSVTQSFVFPLYCGFDAAMVTPPSLAPPRTNSAIFDARYILSRYPSTWGPRV